MLLEYEKGFASEQSICTRARFLMTRADWP